MINADNLLFLSPISLRLPSELYDLIEADALLFGFKKNGKSNINGFLNELLPSIIEVQSNIPYSTIFPTNDKQIASIAANSTFYLNTIFKSLLKGNNVTISFRVNKAHEKDFQKIYEDILPVCNMDFSALFRSLLILYINNRLAIRERFLYFKNYTAISDAIIEKKQCLIFLKEERLLLSCAKICISPISDRNILLGIAQKTGNAHAIPFNLVTNVITQSEDGIPVKNKLKILKKAFLEYLKIEKTLQDRK